jgi:hypothetical protein
MILLNIFCGNFVTDVLFGKGGDPDGHQRRMLILADRKK